MKQAVGADGKITDIVPFRDGLMIGLLALRPVRRRTFSLKRTIFVFRCPVTNEIYHIGYDPPP
jgi:hypothetical protein